MTAPHYGKRNLGLGTAASPGDTLLFNFASYNDSGDSEVLSGLAVADIEVIKDGSATVRATDSGYSLISDTGMVGDRAGLYRFRVQLFNTADDASFYANGSWYQVFVDSVTIDGKTVRFWCGSFEIGEPRANVVQLGGDTGALGWLRATFASGFADTGINDNLSRIRFDVDTGLRAQIADADTGIHDAIADLDTGIRALLALRDTGAIATAVWAGDTGLRDHITNVDTGLTARLGGVLSANVTQIRGDTGAADRFFRYTQKLDTGGDATVSASIDTGQVNQAVWQANAQRKLTVDTGIAEQVWKTTTASYNDDTGTFGELLRIPATASVDTGQVNQAVWQANAVRGITAISDTGINDHLGRIRSDVDTGLRAQIADADTGIHDAIADLDTGIRALLALRDTGAIATAIWAGDTGLRDHITNVDTGITNRLNIIASDVDTGLRDAMADYDSGMRALVSAVKTKTDSLTFTVAGFVDGNIQYVNDVAIQGAGDTGTGNTWRPA
jgi:hypothetical protein